MAFQTIWYYTDLPLNIIESIESDLSNAHSCHLTPSRVGSSAGQIIEETRKSKHAWVPGNNWVAGFLWHYVQKANQENFLYDIDGFDLGALQFTVYSEGEYYKWHNDSGLAEHYKPQGQNADAAQHTVDYLNTKTERIRKLSVVLQLSNPEDYKGGNLQIIDGTGKSYIAPRQRGAVVVFDSRSMHRVLKVQQGVRKSLVGWVTGPRWK